MAVKASNQISIVDVTDAYSVILTSEAYTFVGGTSGAASGSTCSTQAVAFCGNSQCSVVSVDQTKITCPTGISAAVTNNNTASPTITFTTTAVISAACEATIPVVVDGITVNKKFSFAVAKTGQQGGKGDPGATGKGVSSVTITYGSSTSNTEAPTCDATTPPSVAAGSYLWTKFVYNYTDGTHSDPAYTVAKQGSTGGTGAQGSGWYSGTGITGTSTTATVFSGSGVSSAKVNDQYLNTSTGNTYKCTTAGAATVAKWVYTGNIKGAQGNAGADAITMSITSSAGTVFKNNSGSTVLTAHVYKAGAEQTITDAGVCGSLGNVKWYKGTTLVATARTLTVSASDVDNVQAYSCQLES